MAACVTRRKHYQPGITRNDNTTHVPTAGSSAALTKLNHTPTRHPRAKGKLIPKTVTRSRRTHVTRTQECALTRLVMAACASPSLQLAYRCSVCRELWLLPVKRATNAGTACSSVCDTVQRAIWASQLVFYANVRMACPL